MQKRILIVEDDLITREMLTSNAEKLGYDVKSVTDGIELLIIVGEEKFDLIITDLIMPNMSGASAADIMRSLGNTTPVIALTGLPSEVTCLFKDIFVKVFHKQCDFNELFEYVDSII